MPDEIIHACPPDDSGLAPCCGRTPFELRRTDRITSEAEAVTCEERLSNVPCKAWSLSRPHAAHAWRPELGMRPVGCPGHPCACPNPPRHEPTCPSTADLWRGVAPGGTDCLFCRRGDPEANRIIAENQSCFARWDNFPAAPGHAEIVPKRHVESFFDLTAAEIADAYRLLATVRATIDTQHQPDGYTIGVNEGQAAGRTIDHLHIHLIPRRHGDSPDPRGGIRRVIPGDDPDQWAAPNNPPTSVDRNGCDLGCDHGDPCGDCLADMGAPELTAMTTAHSKVADYSRSLEAAIQNRHVPPPPGSTAEQLPDAVLSRISALPYLSTACQAAVLLDDASITDLTVDPELASWADRMHARCRLQNKFTGQPCSCQHHDQEAPDA